MGLECSECERDMRYGHDQSCSRARIEAAIQRREESAQDAQIAALAAREKAYLSELADYGKTVQRLRAQITRLQEASTAEVLKHREQREAMAKHIQEPQDNLDAFLAQREMERNRKAARDAE